VNWIETLAAPSTLRPADFCRRSKIIAKELSVNALPYRTGPSTQTSAWQVWLFTLYGKDEMDELSNDDRRELASALSTEVTLRNNK